MGVGKGFFGKFFNDGGFVVGGVDEFVVENFNFGVVVLELDDLVDDGLSFGEGGDVFVNIREV